MRSILNDKLIYEVLSVVAEIPQGRVATYGQIALLCGKPRNARQVGYALNRGRAGADVPAFRVVNGQGVLSGAQAFSRPNTQKKLLAGDGIRVSADNRVDLKRFGWHNTLDEALFLRQEFERLGI